jgi:hypothetical protein
VVGPGAIAAAMAAEQEASQRRDQVRDALGRDLEAARYAADRAFRQIAPSVNMMQRIPPIVSWPANSKRAGTRHFLKSRR